MYFKLPFQKSSAIVFSLCGICRGQNSLNVSSDISNEENDAYTQIIDPVNFFMETMRIEEADSENDEELEIGSQEEA